MTQKKVLAESIKDSLKPGSVEAIKQGCQCPVIQNALGLGFTTSRGNHYYWIDSGCGIHNKPKPSW